MKKLLLCLVSILFTIVVAGTAAAIPFQVKDSSLSVDWNEGGGIVSYSNSMSSPVNLEQGQSTTFTFGQIFFPLAWGNGTADLSIEFSTPHFSNPVRDEGNFKVWSFFFISGGDLKFGDPVSFAYSYDGATGGIMTLDLENLSGFQLGSWANITGIITNTASSWPVTEPSTMLLLGASLLGFAGIKGKKLFK